jgi:hypothetical protein
LKIIDGQKLCLRPKTALFPFFPHTLLLYSGRREMTDMANIPKKFLDKLQGKNVDTSKLEKIADGVKKNDLQDEQKLRQLVRQLALLANVSLSKEKEDKIVAYVNKNNVQGQDMKTLANLLKNKL